VHRLYLSIHVATLRAASRLSAQACPMSPWRQHAMAVCTPWRCALHLRPVSANVTSTHRHDGGTVQGACSTWLGRQWWWMNATHTGEEKRMKTLPALASSTASRSQSTSRENLCCSRASAMPPWWCPAHACVGSPSCDFVSISFSKTESIFPIPFILALTLRTVGKNTSWPYMPRK